MHFLILINKITNLFGTCQFGKHAKQQDSPQEPHVSSIFAQFPRIGYDRAWNLPN